MASPVLDTSVEALAQVLVRRIGQGIPSPRGPKIVGTWLDDFRATMGDPKMRPIMTLFRGDPKMGATPFQGEASYPVFAIWRSADACRWFSNDTDENVGTVQLLWVLPASVDTERVWPLLHKFSILLRRVLEHCLRDLDDYALLDEAGLDSWSHEVKTTAGFAGPGPNALVYPTLSGTFTITEYWKRSEGNLGVSLTRFKEALLRYLLKGVGSDGDAIVGINPFLQSLAEPTQP